MFCPERSEGSLQISMLAGTCSAAAWREPRHLLLCVCVQQCSSVANCLCFFRLSRLRGRCCFGALRVLCPEKSRVVRP